MINRKFHYLQPLPLATLGNADVRVNSDILLTIILAKDNNLGFPIRLIHNSCSAFYVIIFTGFSKNEVREAIGFLCCANKLKVINANQN